MSKKINKRVNEIIKYARRWIGTPYVHQGRQLGLGCDCAGFLIGIGNQFGYEPQDMQGYSPIPRMGELKALIGRQLKQIKVEQIEPGDIVLMDFFKGGNPHHIGLITDYQGGLGIIHCYQNVGKVVEHALNDKWREKIKIAFRFPDIFIAKNIDRAFDEMNGANH